MQQTTQQKVLRILVKTVLCLVDAAVIAGGVYFLRRGALQTEWLTTTDTEALIYGGILGFLGLCLMASGVASLQSKFDWLWTLLKSARSDFERNTDAAARRQPTPAPAALAAAATATAPTVTAPAQPAEEPAPKQTV